MEQVTLPGPNQPPPPGTVPPDPLPHTYEGPTYEGPTYEGPAPAPQPVMYGPSQQQQHQYGAPLAEHTYPPNTMQYTEEEYIQQQFEQMQE